MAARANNVWQPTSIIDSFGLATTFDYSTPGQVKVVSPERSDGVVPTTTIAVSATQGVQSVTDPVGNKTSFGYTSVSGAPKPLITLITAATGARTAVSYQSPSYQTGLTAVATLKLTDAAGNAISPVQTFSLDPPGNNRHNFTGFPNHLPTAAEPDALFASGDAAYTYTTALTTGATTTLSTYDALHRLVRKQIAVTPAAGQAAGRGPDPRDDLPDAGAGAGAAAGQLRPPDAGVADRVLGHQPRRADGIVAADDDHGDELRRPRPGGVGHRRGRHHHDHRVRRPLRPGDPPDDHRAPTAARRRWSTP